MDSSQHGNSKEFFQTVAVLYSAVQFASKTAEIRYCSSAVQPAAPSADLVEEVRQHGHYLRRFKKAETDEQKAENSLAEKIQRRGQSCPKQPVKSCKG